MRRFALFCVLACVGSLPAWAQDSPDRMKTPECLAARTQLDEALAAGVQRERLNAAREQAALKCFGVKPSPPPEGRFLAPPVAGDAIRLRPQAVLPGPAAPMAQPASPPPPVSIPRSPVVTSCDASGCWDSNGARYNQQGPMLMGPRGACTLQAGALNCP
jgi:hypothetical protein